MAKEFGKDNTMVKSVNDYVSPETKTKASGKKPIIEFKGTERKSKNILLLVTPTLKDEVTAEAQRLGLSTNSFITQVIEDYLKRSK